jgi:hypothetical protein
MSDNFNILLELLFNKLALMEDGEVTYGSFTFLNPGVRFAINAGNLQIVPGLSLPVQITGKSTELGIFAYLSFEHPF